MAIPAESPYITLGVPVNATKDQIKIAYRQLSLKYHPDKWSEDKGVGTKEEALEMFKKINNAHEILSDDLKRLKYDNGLDPDYDYGSQADEYSSDEEYDDDLDSEQQNPPNMGNPEAESGPAKKDPQNAGRKRYNYDEATRALAARLTVVNMRDFSKLNVDGFIKNIGNSFTGYDDLATMTSNFNALSAMVIHDIFEHGNLKNAKVQMNQWVSLAHFLAFESIPRDFQSANAILSALNNTPVYNFRKRFGDVGMSVLETDSVNQLAMLDNLFIPQNNSKNLRSAIEDCKKEGITVIPYVGMYQTDATFAKEGNPVKDEDRRNPVLEAIAKERQANVIKKMLEPMTDMVKTCQEHADSLNQRMGTSDDVRMRDRIGKFSGKQMENVVIQVVEEFVNKTVPRDSTKEDIERSISKQGGEFKISALSNEIFARYNSSKKSSNKKDNAGISEQKPLTEPETRRAVEGQLENLDRYFNSLSKRDDSVGMAKKEALEQILRKIDQLPTSKEKAAYIRHQLNFNKVIQKHQVAGRIKNEIGQKSTMMVALEGLAKAYEDRHNFISESYSNDIKKAERDIENYNLVTKDMGELENKIKNENRSPTDDEAYLLIRYQEYIKTLENTIESANNHNLEQMRIYEPQQMVVQRSYGEAAIPSSGDRILMLNEIDSILNDKPRLLEDPLSALPRSESGDSYIQDRDFGICRVQGAYGEPDKPAGKGGMTLNTRQEDAITGGSMPGFSTLDPSSQEQALKNTVEQMQERHGQVENVGSTLCSLVSWVNPETNTLTGVVANVGDSFANFVIIGRDGQVRFSEQLNRLHEGIEETGLGVSRAIGDNASLKEESSHDPDIIRHEIPLQEGDQVFAIVACDGLSTANKFFKTPALSTKDIAKVVQENRGKLTAEIAKALVSAAYQGGYGSTDNISVGVVEVTANPTVMIVADGHGGVKQNSNKIEESGAVVSQGICNDFMPTLKHEVKKMKKLDKEVAHDAQVNPINEPENTSTLAKGAVESVKDTVVDAAKEGYKSVKDSVKDATHDIRNNPKQEAENLSTLAKGAVESVKDTVVDAAKEGYKSVKDATHDVRTNPKQEAENLLINTKSIVSSLSERVGKFKHAALMSIEATAKAEVRERIAKLSTKLDNKDLSPEKLQKYKAEIDTLKTEVKDSKVLSDQKKLFLGGQLRSLGRDVNERLEKIEKNQENVNRSTLSGG